MVKFVDFEDSFQNVFSLLGFENVQIAFNLLTFLNLVFDGLKMGR